MIYIAGSYKIINNFHEYCNGFRTYPRKARETPVGCNTSLNPSLLGGIQGGVYHGWRLRLLFT